MCRNFVRHRESGSSTIGKIPSLHDQLGGTWPDARFLRRIFGESHAESLRGGACKGYGRSVFPIGRCTALIPEEFADIANLGHRVGTLLVVPPVLTGAGKRFLPLGHHRIVNVH